MDVRNTEKQATTIQSWNILISVLLGLAYQKSSVAFKEGVKDGEATDLCLTEHFIESQITNLSIYDENDKEYKITNPSQVSSLPQKLKRLVAHIEHLNLEYLPAGHSGQEKMQITGQQYDFYSADERESHTAGKEKIKAALNLAYTAKAMGWTQIDFGQTSDPIDRLFLMKACQHVGLDYGGETPMKSSVSGVTINKPQLEKSAAVIEAKNAIASISNMSEERKKKIDPVIAAANKAFERFIESKQSPIGSKEIKTTPTAVAPRPESNAAASLGL